MQSGTMPRLHKNCEFRSNNATTAISKYPIQLIKIDQIKQMKENECQPKEI